MDLINKKYFSYIILIVGLFIYCIYISAMNFVLASIVMVLSILFWLTFSIYGEIFEKLFFSKILTGSGIILSLSIFLLYGIEQVAYPQGAILFHHIGIAISLSVLLISLLPLLLYSENNFDYSSKTSEPQSNALEDPNQDQEDSMENWELATEEDIDSGKFEVAA